MQQTCQGETASQYTICLYYSLQRCRYLSQVSSAV